VRMHKPCLKNGETLIVLALIQDLGKMADEY
jgi:hypothetical protein